LLYLAAVDPKNFGAPAFGAVVKTPGPHGYYTYVPQPIPRRLTLSPDAVLLLSDADRALGRLAGAGRLLPNPHLLVQPYVMREALASSRIEGTQASLSDVFDAAVFGTASGDVREVGNYVAALQAGLALLDELPISMRLLCRIHEVLLHDVRGQERRPGEVRKSPNWIGSPDNRPETAVYVPPPVDEMSRLLTDWDHFVNGPAHVPPLVKCALMHYQFETIHPFLDGNGRLGRLLIVFYLVEQAMLPEPLLYISAYFEEHRGDYYDRLQAVREQGELDEWIRFFLTAVRVQALDALERAERLMDLREDYLRRLAGTRSRARDVVELLFQNPIVSARYVRERLGLTHQGAMNLIRTLEGMGVVQEYGHDPGGAIRWVGREVLRALEGTSH
jgi:Fic family protein